MIVININWQRVIWKRKEKAKLNLRKNIQIQMKKKLGQLSPWLNKKKKKVIKGCKRQSNCIVFIKYSFCYGINWAVYDVHSFKLENRYEKNGNIENNFYQKWKLWLNWCITVIN